MSEQISKSWETRIRRANKDYQEWENRFRCKVLEDYYEGKQWSIIGYTGFTGVRQEPYYVNLIYSTIKTKAANLLLSYPEYKISPKPGNSDWNQEYAMLSAQIKQDALNTVVSNDREAFS